MTYEGKSFSAEPVLSDSKLDIAFLAVEDADFTPLEIGNIDDAKIGDDIYTVGAPNSMAYTLTKGVISAKDRSISGQKYIQIDAAINSGNSGGPLLDDEGYVLGMNTLKLSNSEGIGLAIPIKRITEFAKTNGISFDMFSGDKSEQSKTTSKEKEETENDSSADNLTKYENTPESSREESKREFSLPIIITVAVALIIAILAMILVYKKNADKYIKKIDPSDRTDFEIDIEE